VTDVERVARDLCVAAGDDPDRRMKEYGRTFWTYPAWEDFRDAARRQLEAVAQQRGEGA
jgi:hypothetical protein